MRSCSDSALLKTPVIQYTSLMWRGCFLLRYERLHIYQPTHSSQLLYIYCTAIQFASFGWFCPSHCVTFCSAQQLNSSTQLSTCIDQVCIVQWHPSSVGLGAKLSAVIIMLQCINYYLISLCCIVDVSLQQGLYIHVPVFWHMTLLISPLQ